MTESQNEGGDLRSATPDEIHSALFAQLVLQQSSIALTLLGKSPHPQTGKATQDLEGARLFIDQLEMIEAKTRGNLTKAEEVLLKQTLMTLRMAFVDAAEHPQQPQSESTPPAPPAPETKTAPAADAGAEESKKRFSKKFSL